MLTDNDILKYFCGPKLKNIQKKKLENIPEDILEYLNNRYNDSLSIRETIIRIKLNIDVHPLCPHCNKPVELHSYKSYFMPTCGDKECNKKEFNKNFKATMLDRYGYEYNFQNKDILDKSVALAHSKENIEKAVQTSIERYGADNYRNRKKAKETSLAKYGHENYNNHEQAKRTKLERYGDEHYTNLEKTKQTKLERYGDEYYTNPEKIKQTCLEKYGVDNILNSKEIQDKIHNILSEKFNGNTFNIDKCKETWIEKYNVDNPWKSDIVKEHIKNTNLQRYGKTSWSATDEGRKRISEIGLDKEIQNKKYNTFKKNNSFNISKPENVCYELLLNKFNNVIRQYKSDKYPYCCDFYIPDLDLYIEYNGSQYHHGHPFNENNINDINELNRLKECEVEKLKYKSKTQYSLIIKTWTVSDVNKRKTAFENKLNFHEFYTIDELKAWIESM